MPSVEPHRVVVLALPGVLMLDLAAPVHLFGHCGEGHYSLVVAGLTAGPVPTSTGVAMYADHALGALQHADTIVVPGWSRAEDRRAPLPAVEAVRAAHDRGARVMSICTGAFLLGEAGLLDGRRATTHWHETGRLAERFPASTVDAGVLYVDEGSVLTSAGVASGLDLCLHVIRRDHGATVASAIARRTVVAPHRDGGQAQFVPRPLGEPASAGRAAGLQSTRAWALEHLAEPLDVGTLARHACVSPRTFARRFREETGTTPNRWILAQRVAAAQRMLEATDQSIEAVATASGFGSTASLREHFRRHAHTSPTAYRRAFSATARERNRPLA